MPRFAQHTAAALAAIVLAMSTLHAVVVVPPAQAAPLAQVAATVLA